MSASPRPVPASSEEDSSSTYDIQLARQPIFDRADRVAGYELLYSADMGELDGFEPDQGLISSSLVTNALLGFGMETLTGNVAGFVPLTREHVLDRTHALLDPRRVVLELLPTSQVDEELVKACTDVLRASYVLALDDFVPDDPRTPLLPLAGLVRVNVRARAWEETAAFAGAIRRPGLRLVATGVDAPEARARAAAAGFDLFQGRFYAVPETVSQRDLAPEQATIAHLMRLLRNPDVGDAQVEAAFRADVALTYKLLRMANSAALGGTGVTSIGHALRLIGRATLHRWLALILVSSMGLESGSRTELVTSALVRARLCEAIAEATGARSSAGPLFMVGLVSLLDALLQMPMEAICASMDLAPDVRRALLHQGGRHQAALELAIAVESADWAGVRRHASTLGVGTRELAMLHRSAVLWARQLLHADD